MALEAAADWHGGAGNAMARVCGVAVALAAPPVDGGAAIAVVLTIFPITPGLDRAGPRLGIGAPGRKPSYFGITILLSGVVFLTSK